MLNSDQENALNLLKANLNFKYPGINIRCIQGDYNQVLPKLREIKEQKLVLFLGSNLGNCDYRDSYWFLKKIYENLRRDGGIHHKRDA